MIASDAQGDPTYDPRTVTRTSNSNEKVTKTSNRNIKQKLLSNLTLPVLVPTMNPRIEQRIATIIVAPQTLLTPAMNEVIADAVSGGAWVNRNPRQVSRNGVNGSTPGDMSHVVSVKYSPSPVLIGIVATYPPCGLIRILRVTKKRQSTSLDLAGNT